MRVLLLLAVFVVAGKFARAQSDESWFAFPVASVEDKGAGRYLVTLDYGTESGINKGARAEVWASLQQQRKGEARYLNTITLQDVSLKKTSVLVESKEPVYKNDVVFVKIKVKPGFKSSYFYLASYGIFFSDEAGKPYYTIEEILSSDGYRLRTEKFVKMQMALNEEGRRLKDSNNSDRVKEGPNKGMLVSDVLEKADTISVWSYLYHATLQYNYNTGLTLPWIKSYTDYAWEGDRVTDTELRTVFVGASQQKMEASYTHYKRRITKSMVKDWYNEAVDFRKSKQFEDARKVLEACIFLGAKLDDPYNEALYHYEVALLEEARNQYAAAIPWYEKAKEKFIAAKSDYGAGFAEHYMGMAYLAIDDYSHAEAHLENAEALRRKVFQLERDRKSYQDDLIATIKELARLARKQSNFAKAVSRYESAMSITRTIDNAASEADLLWSRGYMYSEEMNKRAEGVADYERAHKIFTALRDTSGMIEMKRNLAINLDKLSQHNKAKAAAAEAVKYARQWNNTEKLAYALEYEASLLFKLKEYDQSNVSYLECEKIYMQLKDTANLVSVKRSIYKNYRDSKNPKAGLAKIKEVFPLLKKDDYRNLSDAWWDMAFIHGKDYVNNPRKAIDYYGEAIKIYKLKHDTTNLATVYNNVAYQYRDLGDSLNAYKHHQLALTITSVKHRASEQADTHDRWAVTCKHFGNKAQSLFHYREAHRLFREAGNEQRSAELLLNVGKGYAAMKNYAKANEVFLQAVSVFNTLGDKAQEAESHWEYAYNQGTNLFKYDEAIGRYRVAYKLYMEAGDSVNASVMLSNIGQNYWSKLEFEKAIESHQAAIALAKKCRNLTQVASSWSKLATLFTETNNPVAAQEALNNTVEALHQVNDSTQLSAAYQDLAASYVKTKAFSTAFDYYNKAIDMLKARKDTVSWALAISNLAGGYQSKTDYKEAEKLYLETLALQRKIKDKPNLIYTLANLGTLAQAADNNYKKAGAYFDEAVKLAIEIKDDNILAFCYLRLKGLNRSQGKFAASEDYIRKALDIYTKTNRSKDAAYTLVEMGNDASYVYGDNVKALKLLDQAQAISDTLNDVTLKAYLLEVRSNIMAEAGEFQKALEFGHKSFELYRSTNNEWGLAGAYIDLGNVYKQLSEYDKSLRYQMASDSLYRKVNSEYNRLAPLANIGTVYTAQGDYSKGLEYYQKSYEIMQKAGDYNENFGIVHSLIGESYYYLNDYAQADKWLRQALTVFDKVGAPRPKAEALSMIGRLKIEEKKYDEAARFLNEGAKSAKEKSLRVDYLANINLLGQLEVLQKNYAKAKPILEETISVSREISKYNTLWESLYWLGILYKENKQLPQSRDYLKEAVVVIEKIRNKVSGGEEARKLFSSDKHILKVYEALVDVLLQLGETELAMSYLQKNNEDNLKAKFKNLDVKFEDTGKSRIVEQERNMKARLDGIELQIANEKALPADQQNRERLKYLEGTKTIAEGDYLKFVNQQVNVRPELTKYFNNSVQPVEFRREKKNIPEDMALLSYLPGENQLYIFVATRDTVIAKIVNVGREQLGRNVNAILNVARNKMGTFDKLDISHEAKYRQELVYNVRQQEKAMVPFEEMYQYLVAPAAAEIASKRRLGIIATGVLNYIPFQLLGKTLANGEFNLLASQFAIFYVSSTNILRLAESEKAMKIIAFGNPDKSLPSTEREVAEIKKLYPSSAVFLQDQATEDKVKTAGEDFTVMHFATHGNLDYEDFTQSFLTMAGGNDANGDGKLTLEELWGMEVMNHLDIVVLSACQTAVTKGSAESSPVSPASGFLQNGVKSVVATLWKVDDEATSLLMTEFYRNMRTMATLDALREAQITLSRNPKYQHPYYWAGAILLGDWR
ncbi:MAG: tetratricopeptide repeat protein [Cyclobacteriaceae bacterium]|nr:tetratricopeptide repeat protein [Cyclobacteriaceae bacterium]